MSNWRVFETNDDWTLARSTKEAKEFYANYVGIEEDEVDCKEVHEAELKELKFYDDLEVRENDGEPSRSFWEQYQIVLSKNPTQPDILAVSEI